MEIVVMNNCTIAQTKIERKSPKKHPQAEAYRDALLIDGVLARELAQLQDVRETLLKLPCSQKIKPIVATLSELLDLARDQRHINIERLEVLVCAAREEVMTM